MLIAEPASFFAPTRVFDDKLDIVLAGVRFEFRYAPSEADDEIVMWLPDLGVLLSAEVIQGECLANVHTLRGTRYRDPVRWYQTIDMMRGFNAAHMVPAHGRPVSGAEHVADVLCVYRDAIQFIHDQTIRHMNFGMSPDELAEAIPALPPHLAGHAWLGEYYGTVKHSVRQVYSGQLGWFDGDPASLDPLPRAERSRRMVEMMGGAEAVRAAARGALGRVRLALGRRTGDAAGAPRHRRRRRAQAQGDRVARTGLSHGEHQLAQLVSERGARTRTCLRRHCRSGQRESRVGGRVARATVAQCVPAL